MLRSNLKDHGLNILYLAVIDWHFIKQRIQHLATLLSERHRVIYVHPRTVMRYFRMLRQEKPDPNIDLSILRKMGENLELYHPLILPQYKFRLVGKINRALFRFSLKRFLRERDFRPSVLWVTHPTQVDCLGLLPTDFVCYDCVDNWPGFFDGKRKKEIVEKETRLLSRADLVLVTSQVLQKRIKNQAKNVYLVPNGVEAEHFSLVIQRGLPIPEDMRNLKRPVIGYVGAVAEWLDFDLIAYAAQRKKDFSFVFIGPLLGVKEARYRHITNLHFLNSKPYQVLPNYMKQMDVMILPFKMNELTKSVDPVKAYEYLAAGKQVVATNMPELYKFGNLVKIARNKQQFVESLDQCLRETECGEHDPRVGSESMKQHTWTRRANEIERILVEHLGHKT